MSNAYDSTSKKKPFEQLLEEKRNQYTTEPYSTPLCGSPLYQKRDVLEAMQEWLKQKQRKVDGCERRNGVKGLLVAQGQQQMLEKLLAELEK